MIREDFDADKDRVAGTHIILFGTIKIITIFITASRRNHDSLEIVESGNR